MCSILVSAGEIAVSTLNLESIMLSAILASALSMGLYHAGTPPTEYAPQISTAQYNELRRIDQACRPNGVPTLYEKLTASTQPRLRLQACIEKKVAASPTLLGWHAITLQGPSKK